jgi:hypothetical protein
MRESEGAERRKPLALRVVQTPLPLQCEPVPLLTLVEESYPTYAWSTTSAQLMPVPAKARVALSKYVLGGGGRTLFYVQAVPKETGGSSRRWGVEVERITFETGRIDRADFTDAGPSHQVIDLGGSPEGDQFALIEALSPDPADPAKARAKIWLAGFGGSPPRELLTIPGISGGGDLPVQWCPDGSGLLAVSVWLPPASPREFGRAQILLFDTQSGSQLGHIKGTLIGSASFSPDGSRLLVRNDDGVLVQDLLTGESQPLDLLASPHHRKIRNACILGFASNTQLLIATHRGNSITLSAVNLDGSDQEPILSWNPGPDIYPIVASMPEDFWTSQRSR